MSLEFGLFHGVMFLIFGGIALWRHFDANRYGETLKNKWETLDRQAQRIERANTVESVKRSRAAP
jgi:hypothetical protein